MHALAKDSPGWPGVVSVTDLPCVHAIYMEDHRRQTTDSCKKLMVSVCETTPLSFFLRFGIALVQLVGASYNIAATTTCASRVSVLVGHRKKHHQCKLQ